MKKTVEFFPFPNFIALFEIRTFTTADDSDDEDEKLNIFSLASGHLYERFLKIMMLSVIKHTKSPVKFWFLKNYLSPTLKVSDYVHEVELLNKLNDIFQQIFLHFRIFYHIWQRNMVLNMNWYNTNGLAGSISKLKSKEPYGVTKYCFWMCCSL